ncbi:MAG: glycoside hydrolase family 2, partial [Tepidisphaeraceae bacterium]
MITARRAACSAVCVVAMLLMGACTHETPSNPSQGLAAAPGDTGQALFNDGWLFSLSNTDASAASFDDSSWRKLDLPHDWSVEGPYDGKWAAATAFLPGGIGWYRKHFTSPLSGDQELIIRFDGV